MKIFYLERIFNFLYFLKYWDSSIEYELLSWTSFRKLLLIQQICILALFK